MQKKNSIFCLLLNIQSYYTKKLKKFPLLGLTKSEFGKAASKMIEIVTKYHDTLSSRESFPAELKFGKYHYSTRWKNG